MVGKLLYNKTSGFGGGFRVRAVRKYLGTSVPATALMDESDNPFHITVQQKDVTSRPTGPTTYVEPPPVLASGTRILTSGWYFNPENGELTEDNPNYFRVWYTSGGNSGYSLAERVNMQGTQLGVEADISYSALVKANVKYGGTLYDEAELPKGMAIAYKLDNGRLGALKVLEIGDIGDKHHALRFFFITYEKPAEEK